MSYFCFPTSKLGSNTICRLKRPVECNPRSLPGQSTEWKLEGFPISYSITKKSSRFTWKEFHSVNWPQSTRRPFLSLITPRGFLVNLKTRGGWINPPGLSSYYGPIFTKITPYMVSNQTWHLYTPIRPLKNIQDLFIFFHKLLFKSTRLIAKIYQLLVKDFEFLYDNFSTQKEQNCFKWGSTPHSIFDKRFPTFLFKNLYCLTLTLWSSIFPPFWQLAVYNLAKYFFLFWDDPKGFKWKFSLAFHQIYTVISIFIMHVLLSVLLLCPSE